MREKSRGARISKFYFLGQGTHRTEWCVPRTLIPSVRLSNKRSPAEFVKLSPPSPAGTTFTLVHNDIECSRPFCSTDCRHIFCAMCLLSWWQTKQENSCPTCRTIAKSPPVRDPVQGFVALARAHAGEAEQSDSFDEDIFDAFFPAKAPNSSGSRRAPIEIS